MNPPRADAEDDIQFLLGKSKVVSATEAVWVQPVQPRSPAHDAFARHVSLVAHHGSGNHHAVVRGINLITTLWADGDQFDPCDGRTHHKATDSLTRNGHFAAMLRTAKDRGFRVVAPPPALARACARQVVE